MMMMKVGEWTFAVLIPLLSSILISWKVFLAFSLCYHVSFLWRKWVRFPRRLKCLKIREKDKLDDATTITTPTTTSTSEGEKGVERVSGEFSSSDLVVGTTPCEENEREEDDREEERKEEQDFSIKKAPTLQRKRTYFQWFEAACARETEHLLQTQNKSRQTEAKRGRKGRANEEGRDRNNNDRMKKNKPWRCYDEVLLRDRRAALKEARLSQDIHYLKETLRGELVRDLGHVAESSVFEGRVLPPQTIRKFVKEVVRDLQHVMDYRGEDFPLDEKIKYITEIYYSYGSTALLLSGGGSLGSFHLGVLRALCDQDCLPHIIAGSSGGSVIAALAGSRSFADLQNFLQEDSLSKLSMWFKFSSFSEILSHYLKKGHLQDIEYFQGWLKDLFGDLTFMEAREVSGRILNIVISPAHTNEPPRVLNCINAPNVMIWSAVSCSCAFPLLFPPQDLQIKMKNRRNAPFANTRSIARTRSGRWHDGSLGEDLPIQKLKEYFHVSFSIVSQTNLHAAPWLTVKQHLPSTLAYLIQSEFQHRFRQLERLFPIRRLSGWFKLFHTSWEGDFTVVLPMTMSPLSGIRSVLKAVTRLTSSKFLDLVNCGEEATFPKIQGIRTLTAIEREINRSLQKLSNQISHEESYSKEATSVLN